MIVGRNYDCTFFLKFRQFRLCLNQFFTRFLKLLFMLVIPLLFSALVVGVAEMGDLKSLGRAGIKTLLLTIVVSGIAVVIGLGMVNLFRPGDGVADGGDRLFARP